jgi:hypothetical protein
MIGGYYDDNYKYIHGVGWDETNQCYKSRLEDCEHEEEDYGGIYNLSKKINS